MATLVLVHGAWLGGWVWSRVLPDLRARGHVVFAPTLTGLGERDHLLGPDIDLELHATDVLNLLEYEDLQRVLLVGHGYGGTVAQRVAALAPERIGRLAFLDATLARPHPDTRPDPDLAAIIGDEWSVFIMSVIRRRVYTTIGAFDEEMRSNEDYDFWLRAAVAGFTFARNDRPLGHYRIRPDSLSASDVRMIRGILHVYTKLRPVIAVRCTTGDPAAATGLAVAGEHGFPAHEIEGGHLVMLSKPEPTAELLDNFARQPAARFARVRP